jgi:UTP:GlnB (protein PII) uridylyltransferase
MFFDDHRRLRSLVASWTDVDTPDAFTMCSAGRSWFRTDDLLQLRALIDDIAKGRKARGRVK